MNKRKSLRLGIIILLIVILSIVLIRNSENKENDKNKITIQVINQKKTKDGTLYVTAEIANNSAYPLDDNKIFIVENSQGVGGVTTSGNTSTSNFGVSNHNDKPKNVEVKELSGIFTTIDPHTIVRIGFSVPAELTDKEILMILQGLASKEDNRKEYITITQPLPLQ